MIHAAMLMFSLESQLRHMGFRLRWPRPVDALPWSLRTWASLARRNAGMGNMLQKQASSHKIWGQVLGAVQWDIEIHGNQHADILDVLHHKKVLHHVNIKVSLFTEYWMVHSAIGGICDQCRKLPCDLCWRLSWTRLVSFQHQTAEMLVSPQVWFRSFSSLNGWFVGEPAVNLPGCINYGTSQYNIPNGTMDHWLQLSAMHDLPCLVKALELEDESLKSFKGQLDSDVVPWAAPEYRETENGLRWWRWRWDLVGKKRRGLLVSQGSWNRMEKWKRCIVAGPINPEDHLYHQIVSFVIIS